MIRVFFLFLVAFSAFGDDRDQVQINSPFVATPGPVVDAMLTLAKTKPSDVVYDLGCGDGRIVIQAAKQYGARGVGIDNNPDRIREARENARREGVGDLVRFQVGDLYDADIQEATVVALYLLPDVNIRLRPKLKSELRPGARVVSHTFNMGNWKPKKKTSVAGANIYLWRVGHRFWPFA